jgi:hypothetical protein
VQPQSLFYTYAYPYADSHGDVDCHINSDSDGNCNAYSNGHCDSDSNGEADPYAKVRPNTTVSPYSTTAPVGFVNEHETNYSIRVSAFIHFPWLAVLFRWSLSLSLCDVEPRASTQ